MVSIAKSTHCILQTATLTPFRIPIPAYGLNPEKREKIWELFTVSFMELTSLKKRLCHKHMQSIGSNDQKC